MILTHISRREKENCRQEVIREVDQSLSLLAFSFDSRICSDASTKEKIDKSIIKRWLDTRIWLL